MSINVSAYVEKQNPTTKKWELVGNEPVGSRLKYVFSRYSEYPRLNWDDLSDGLKEKFPKGENGEVYSGFHAVSLNELESEINSDLRKFYGEANVIFKALGCVPAHDSDGEPVDVLDYDDDSAKLTFPISKALVGDLQYGLDKIRNLGSREAFDLIVNDKVSYDDVVRVVFVVN